MTEPAIAMDRGLDRAEEASLALSADGRHVAVVRGGVLEIDGAVAGPAVAAAIVEREVWCVSRGERGHRVQRLGLDGGALGEALPLGELGGGVQIRAAARCAHALIAGAQELELRVQLGELVVHALGERLRDARILVPGRGVLERRGSALVLLRAGTLAELSLALPADIAHRSVVGGAVVMDGALIVVELAGYGQPLLLTYDARRGGLQSRVRVGEATLLASAERAGVVVIGRERHVAILDLRRGQCDGERVLAGGVRAVAIDAAGGRVVVLDATGQVFDLDAQPVHDEPEEIAAPEPVPAPVAEPRVPVAAPDEPTGPATIIVPYPDVPLFALRPRDDAWDGEVAGYLGALRTWIAATARSALAVAHDVGRLGGDPASQLDALLAARGGRAPARVAEAREAEAAAAIALAPWGAAECPHTQLARDLGLSELAVCALLLAAAPQIWGELARVYGVLAGDPARAVVDELLLAELLDVDAADRAELARELDPEGSLARAGAIELGKQPRPYASITVHPVVVRRLLGEQFAAGVELPLRLDDVIAPREAVTALLAALAAEGDAPVRVVVRGRPSSGRRTLAAALAARAGREVVVIAPVPGADAELVLARALHDASLRGHIPCVTVDDLPEEPELRARIRRVLDAHPAPLFVRAPLEAAAPLAPGHCAIALRPLTETERRDVWAEALALHDLPVALADRLAARFAVAPGVVDRACERAVAAADPEAALADAIRQHRSGRLSTIASRVDRLASWDDLVLPPDILDGMRELVARVSCRRTVLETWGMERAASTACGVTALFQGGPGTGKTMAAGALAHALGYELWRVDLSKVMSRWLGETEKNLAAVFDAAEDGEVVLLFDEADSLFGKRTDVKSSNDRYANLEVNYLLQRLDEFTGVAVLTTNFGTSIDAAFKRRLSLHAQFPFPDEADRERLWRAHLPPSVPVAGELKLDALARTFELSGGLIRNATLRAAYLAAAERSSVSHDHLVRAVRLEYLARGQLGSGRLE